MEQGKFMARPRVAKLPRRAVKHAIQQTHEHSRVIDLEQLLVDMEQSVADRTRAPGFRAEQVGGQCHEQRCGHALVRDVANHNAEGAFAQGNEVKEVSAYRPRRHHPRSEIEAGRRGSFRGTMLCWIPRATSSSRS